MNNSDIYNDYVILPSIASIEINKLGPILHANMEFNEKVTVISSKTGAPGVSTLVHAFRIIRGTHVINFLDRRIGPLHQPIDPAFSVKYKWKDSQGVIRHLIEKPTPQEVFERYALDPTSNTTGNIYLRSISNIIFNLREDLCLVLDKDFIGPLSLPYAEAVINLLLNAPAQVIVFIGAMPNILFSSLRPFCRYELVSDGINSTIRPV